MKLRNLLYISFLLVGLFSCQSEDDGYLPNPREKGITIELDLPNNDYGQRHIKNNRGTYAMPADENTINSIDVLSFLVDPAFPNDMQRGTFFQKAAVSYTAGQTSFKVVLSEHTKNQTLVVLVNARSAVQALLASQGDTKASVMASLILAETNAFDGATMNDIPMWGEIPNQLIDGSYTSAPAPVKLVRMLSKIDIQNNELASTFTLKSAYIYNPKKEGAYMPDNWTDANSAVATPTLPAGAATAQGANVGPYTTLTNSFESRIFTFEADNKAKAAGSLLDATCIIVGGSYNGSATETYYRIDLKNYTTDVFFDVLRNHSYNITINQVSDEGADTPDDAFRGNAVIKATVDPWNDALADAQYGQSRLYVSKRHPSTKLNGTLLTPGSNTVKIKTTVGSGWKFDLTDATTAATLAWANPTVTDGVANTEVEVIFNPLTTPTGRDGEIKIISGDLTYKIYFIQDDCGRRGFALPQRIGTRDYLTLRYETGPCWMVENSKEGTPHVTRYNNDPTKVSSYYGTRIQVTSACPAPWRNVTSGPGGGSSNKNDAESLLANLAANPANGYYWWYGPRMADQLIPGFLGGGGSGWQGWAGNEFRMWQTIPANPSNSGSAKAFLIKVGSLPDLTSAWIRLGPNYDHTPIRCVKD